VLGQVQPTSKVWPPLFDAVVNLRRGFLRYVPQDDILLPELTVYENILHSARVRLPVSWSDREVRDYVNTFIRCLQLSHVKDSLVGSPAMPVISGGQRKRVSIGMELAAAPMALFLDEPTSGLDATAAASIMSILKALTKVGITVVSIIHQPRQEIFESLDSLLLLGAGRMLYQGPTREVQLYFESVGFQFPRYCNPADVVMDIIAGQGKQYSRYAETRVDTLIQYWALQGRTQPQIPSLGSLDAESLRCVNPSPLVQPALIVSFGSAFCVRCCNSFGIRVASITNSASVPLLDS
jgi:ABC-type multidrug transport system ATPase subunit